MTDPQSVAQAIASLYPEIAAHGIAVSVADAPAAGAWRVTLTHAGNTLDTYLDHNDADDCVSGVKCVSLGVQIGRFVENYCLARGECPK